MSIINVNRVQALDHKLLIVKDVNGHTVDIGCGWIHSLTAAYDSIGRCRRQTYVRFRR